MNSYDRSHNRGIAIVVCMLTIVACFSYAFFRARLPDWWRDHGGGIPYVVFWCSFGFVLFPSRRAVLTICVVATAATCSLEFLQLWKPLWLTRFRATRFGAALLGADFAWNDIPPYFIGGGIGFAVLISAL